MLENFMLFPTWCRNLTPLFDGEVVHILHTVEDVGLEGEDVHVLHAEGHVVDTDVEALLDGILEGEVTHVLHAEGAGHVVYVEVKTLNSKAHENSLMADFTMTLYLFSTR